MPVLRYRMDVKHRPQQDTCVPRQTHLIRRLSARSWGSLTHSSYNKCTSQGSVRVSRAFQHGNRTTLEILWPHGTQCSWWWPSPCSCCCNSQASIRLDKTPRKNPTTHGSEPSNQTWDRWTLVLPMRGRKQPLENTGIWLWTWLSSRRVCYEDKKKW